METALIDPQITPTWCQQQQAHLNPRDPTLTRINKRYQSQFARHHHSFLLTPRQSLQHVTGINPKFLMTYMDIADMNIENYYLLPEDQHPSVAGSEAFARGGVGVVKGENGDGHVR